MRSKVVVVDEEPVVAGLGAVAVVEVERQDIVTATAMNGPAGLAGASPTRSVRNRALRWLKLAPKHEAHLVALHAAGEHTNAAELAELLSIGRSTVYRALERAQTRTTA